MILRALCLGLLLGGCVSVSAQEPALPFPQAPTMTFMLDQDGDICMSQADANLLSKWKGKLDAFEAARERLLKVQ